MYFSLVPNPGYNHSFLDTLGIDGEFNLFTGYFLNENNETVLWENLTSNVNNGIRGTWRWGSVNHSIEGKLNQMRTINYIFLKMFGLRAEQM